MMDAHDLRKKDPQRDGGSVDSCGTESRGCHSEGRLDSLFGYERGEIEFATLASLMDSVAEGIKRLMAHGGLPRLMCLGVDRSKLIASEAPCCQPPLKLPTATIYCRLSAIRVRTLFGKLEKIAVADT